MTATRTDIGGDADTRRRGAARRRASGPAVAAFLVPLVAWVLALAQSYVVQDFVCSAAASADAPDPGTTVFVVVTVVNAVLLLVVVAAGVVGFRIAHRPEQARLPRFLGYSAATIAIFCAYGVVLIATGPFFLEVCP